MANKKEKQIIWEIQQAHSKILPLTGLSGGATQTVIDIGRSWLDHAPLHNQVGIMLYNLNNYIHCVDVDEKKYYLGKIENALDKFWELNEENFNESKKHRPKYSD